jgi:Ca2+:H+ antiporter
MHPMELPIHNRGSLYNKLVPSTAGSQRPTSLHRKPSSVPSRTQTPAPLEQRLPLDSTTRAGANRSISPSNHRRVSYANPAHALYSPVLETVDRTVKDSMRVPPETMTTDDFTRAVAVATVSALRHHAHTHSPARARVSVTEESGGGHGGHDAPSWSRTTSASVLLACTALYAVIAGKPNTFFVS